MKKEGEWDSKGFGKQKNDEPDDPKCKVGEGRTLPNLWPTWSDFLVGDHPCVIDTYLNT